MSADKPKFPAPTGDYDDDLTDEQIIRKLSGAEGTRHFHIDLAKTAGAITLRTWECPTHKITVIQGDPCPKCGKKLLLG